jgi:hypothetical protein
MSSDFNYCEPPDVPEGMTLAEYRRARTGKRKPGWRARLRRRGRMARASSRRPSRHRA